MKTVTDWIDCVAGGRYQIEDLTGQSPHGASYLASDLAGEAYVALKVLSEDVSDGALEAIEAYANELHWLDPAFVPVLSVGRLDDGSPYLVRPFVRGRSWAFCLEGLGRMPLRWVLESVEAISRHLEQIHSAGAAHGNLLSANVIVRANRSLALTDAGLAVLGGASVARPDPAVDVRALAATAFELITGAPPDERVVHELSATSDAKLGEAVEAAIALAA